MAMLNKRAGIVPPRVVDDPPTTLIDPPLAPAAFSEDDSTAGSLVARDGSASAASAEAAAAATVATTTTGGSGGSGSGPNPCTPSTTSSDSETLFDFAARAQAAISALGTKVESSCTDFSALVDFFGEDTNMGVEVFFSTLTAFVRALSRARQERADLDVRNGRETKRADSERARGGAAAPATPAQLIKSAGQETIDSQPVLATPKAQRLLSASASAHVPAPTPAPAPAPAPALTTALAAADPRMSLMNMLKKRAGAEE